MLPCPLPPLFPLHTRVLLNYMDAVFRLLHLAFYVTTTIVCTSTTSAFAVTPVRSYSELLPYGRTWHYCRMRCVLWYLGMYCREGIVIGLLPSAC
ncbi:hypothetical protein F5Y10DRAFT_235249 [Nemania abortiva]|nr:hypothetical protein F5Y10DRAFT_235249 [Nemania abortiva]